MVGTRIQAASLVPPMKALEGYLEASGTTILQATFGHSYFVDPIRVRDRTPYYPDHARLSREHYPDKGRGQTATWEGREVKLGDNGRAQLAWKGYTGKLLRGSGYSVRHIWGHPWNPDAFTAGWNICYMPFWAGPLTEDQHPHEGLRQAVQQASWDLFFRDNPVCISPDFVNDPGLDLDSMLGEQPLLLLAGEAKPPPPPRPPLPRSGSDERDTWGQVKEIRTRTHQSWSNICKAIRLLQGKRHQPFGTKNVESSSKSVVRRIKRETRLTLAQLEELLKDRQKWK